MHDAKPHFHAVLYGIEPEPLEPKLFGWDGTVINNFGSTAPEPK